MASPWIYFSPNRPQRYVSVKDVLDPMKEAEVKQRIDGAIILVGASAAGLMDFARDALANWFRASRSRRN